MKKVSTLSLQWLALVSIFTTSTSTTGFAQSINIHPTDISYAVSHDVSPPLSGMSMLKAAEGNPRGEKEIPNNDLSALFDERSDMPGLMQEKDPVLQHVAGIFQPNATIVNIEGIGNTSLTNPPDPVGDVGANHYIQAVNLAFAIYSKTGTLLYGPASLKTIWQGFPRTYTCDGDPIVLYDHLADRWLITYFSLPNYPNGPFYELIAVSQTPDPLGAWYRYAFKFIDMPDYPKFAVWPDGYYMSANRFFSGSLDWRGPEAVVFERDSVLAGKNARMSTFNLSGSHETMLPADLDGQPGPVGSPAYFLGDVKQGYNEFGQVKLYALKSDWSNPANSTFKGPQIINSATFSGGLSGIPQFGSSQVLDPLTRHMMNRLQYRNFGAYQVLMANRSVSGGRVNEGIRWWEF